MGETASHLQTISISVTLRDSNLCSFVTKPLKWELGTKGVIFLTVVSQVKLVISAALFLFS